MRDLSEIEPQFNNPDDSLAEALESVQSMLRSASSGQPLFPPTLLYNEGWLLRLVLNWFARHDVQDHPLSFAVNAKWFSEALLPSAFLARYRGDKLAENWTHADGVVGHFLIGDEGKADLTLLPNAMQFLVLEAKIFSGLSSGVTNARYYDQAARNVACMAEVLRRAKRIPSKVKILGFYVLAPSSQIEQGVFARALSKSLLHEKVWRRVSEYAGEKDGWFSQWFQATWKMVDIYCLSWEEVIATINKNDPTIAESIKAFYNHCLTFNR